MPVHLIITMIKWIRTSTRLSIQNSLSAGDVPLLRRRADGRRPQGSHAIFKLPPFLKLTSMEPFAAWFVVTGDATPDGIRVVRSVLGAIRSLPTCLSCAGGLMVEDPKVHSPPTTHLGCRLENSRTTRPRVGATTRRRCAGNSPVTFLMVEVPRFTSPHRAHSL